MITVPTRTYVYKYRTLATVFVHSTQPSFLLSYIAAIRKPYSIGIADGGRWVFVVRDISFRAYKKLRTLS